MSGGRLSAVFVRIAALIAVVLLGAASRAEEAGPAARHPMQIPAQDLGSALRSFGQLTQLQVIFVSEDVATRVTAGVSGNLAPAETLDRLLRGTGLVYRFVDPRTVSIIPASAGGGTDVPGSAAQAPADNSAAAPESVAAASLDQVTVTSAPQLSEKQLESISAAFVRSHSAHNAVGGQLARWSTPVCPLTIGLRPEMNALVTSRVTDLAALVGAPTAPAAQCAMANVQILFTTEPQKLLDKIAARRKAVLGFHYISRLKRLKAFTQVIQAWYVTATRASEDDLLPRNVALIPEEWVPAARMRTSSEFLNVLIVADSRKVVGYQIGAIADYVAALALSQGQSLAVCNQLASIAELFEDNCNGRAKPEGLTSADTVYLQALYSLDPTESLYAEKSYLTRKVAVEIETRGEPRSGPVAAAVGRESDTTPE
jgi:hypothetical protein